MISVKVFKVADPESGIYLFTPNLPKLFPNNGRTLVIYCKYKCKFELFGCQNSYIVKNQ